MYRIGKFTETKNRLVGTSVWERTLWLMIAKGFQDSLWGNGIVLELDNRNGYANL